MTGYPVVLIVGLSLAIPSDGGVLRSYEEPPTKTGHVHVISNPRWDSKIDKSRSVEPAGNYNEARGDSERQARHINETDYDSDGEPPTEKPGLVVLSPNVSIRVYHGFDKLSKENSVGRSRGGRANSALRVSSMSSFWLTGLSSALLAFLL